MISTETILSQATLTRLVDIRISNPEFAWHAAQIRSRRDSLAPDGKLNILAADHPARRVTGVGANPMAMADRRDYLSRIIRVLSADGVDGLMATMDILEDLLAIDGFTRESGGTPLLDGKLLIASLNRGGLADCCWEIDDPMTGTSPRVCAAWRLDGIKVLLRVADDDKGSLKTMLACAHVINEANALHLPTFLEPLPVKKTEKGWSVIKTAEALASLAGVASALGDSSRYMWLKLPYCENFDAVARATTLPVLLLGGEAAGDPAPFLNELASALASDPNVRGALVGRNVMYPGEKDPREMAAAVAGIIHQGWSVEKALGCFKS